MRKYQLKQPATVDVLGNTESGDYIMIDSAKTAEQPDYVVQVIPKSDFESKYEPAPAAPAADPAPAHAAEVPNASPNAPV